MFCKHCGAPVAPNGNFCTQCGCPTNQGNNFCPNCGQPRTLEMGFCPKCGCILPSIFSQAPKKSKLAAGLLGIFFGSLGVHNFYLGYTGKAVAQLVLTVPLAFLTCGITGAVSSIWGFIEGILILVGNINKDANGNPLDE